MWGKESGRFYEADGTLREDVGLTEARKEALFPSVSEVLMCFRESYGLKKWMEEQLILAAYTTPRADEEDDEVFIARVREAAREEGAAAAETGIDYHAAIASKLEGQAVILPKRVHEWVEQHLRPGAETEKTLVDPVHGYAGTTDYHGYYFDGQVQQSAIIDFKTQGVKGKDTSPRWYETWPIQIAAYRTALGEQGLERPNLGISVVINTSTEYKRWTEEDPGIWWRIWSQSELADAETLMRSMACIWHHVNKWPLKSPDALAYRGDFGTIKSRGTRF